MPVFLDSKEQIFSDIINDVINNTGLTRTTPGGKVRTIVESLSQKLGKMSAQFDLNMLQAFLAGAEGQFLDYIGSMMGVTRIGSAPANISATEENLRFYVTTGTFGDINSGNSILIPSGKIISTGPDGTGIQYRTLANTVLLSTEDTSYIAAQSVRSGDSENTGRGTLIYHNFTDYTDYLNDSLRVYNDADISYAQNVESDSNYRYRISNSVVAAEAANETAIRLAALAVPGVADVVGIKYARGIGTYQLLIKSISPTIGNGLVGAVQNAIDKVTAFGELGEAKAPVEIGLSLIGTITTKTKLSPTDESNLLAAITDNVTTYVNNLDIGETLYISDLLEKVLATSDKIKSIGTLSQPFDALYIYKPSRVEDNKVRSILVTDYPADVDERIITETRYAGDTPILFRTTL